MCTEAYYEINNLDAVAQEALTRKEEQRKLEFEKHLTEQKLEQEKVAAEAKWLSEFQHQQKLKEVHQTKSNPQESTAAKMHKLIISKFTGTPQDWVRFWGQFLVSQTPYLNGGQRGSKHYCISYLSLEVFPCTGSHFEKRNCIRSGMQANKGCVLPCVL